MAPLPIVYKQCLQCKQTLYTKGLPLRGGVTPSFTMFLQAPKKFGQGLPRDYDRNQIQKSPIFLNR